jgi:uncharacterized OsmC-like protein
MAKETLNAEVEWLGEGLHCDGGARDFALSTDEPSEVGGVKSGGGDTAMNPLELLLNALGGCLCTTAVVFQGKLRGGSLKGVRAEVEGDVDFDGLLGKNLEARKGLSEVRAKIYLNTDAPQERIDEFVEFVHQTCPVSDNVANGTILKVSGERE